MASSTSTRARRPGITVLSAVALRSAMVELVALFEREVEEAVSIDFDFNPAVARRIEGGERCDVAVTNPHLIEKLVTLGLLDAATRIPFGTSPLGFAVQESHARVDISSLPAFRQALLAARTIGYAREGTSGHRLNSILASVGLAQEVDGKLRPVAAGHAGHAVAAGEVECSIAPISTLLAAVSDGVVVSTLPADLGIEIDFDAAISPRPRDRALAVAFVDLLQSAAIDPLLRSKGMTRRHEPA